MQQTEKQISKKILLIIGAISIPVLLVIVFLFATFFNNVPESKNEDQNTNNVSYPLEDSSTENDTNDSNLPFVIDSLEEIDNFEFAYHKTIGEKEYIYLQKGRNNPELITEGISPLISPDHTQLAYVKPKEGVVRPYDSFNYDGGDLYVLDLKNNTEKLIPYNSLFTNPVLWSDDSKYLVVEGKRDFPTVPVSIYETSTWEKVIDLMAWNRNYYFNSNSQFVFTQDIEVDPPSNVGNGGSTSISILDLSDNTIKDLVRGDSDKLYLLLYSDNPNLIKFTEIFSTNISYTIDINGNNLTEFEPNDYFSTLSDILKNDYPELSLNSFSLSTFTFPYKYDTFLFEVSNTLENVSKILLVDKNYNYIELAEGDRAST